MHDKALAQLDAPIIEWMEVALPYGEARVGINTISRQGEGITFDAVIEYYARYSANCRTGIINTLMIGSLDGNEQPDPRYLQQLDTGWSEAQGAQAFVLERACGLSE